jgi:hypothetical protein
MVFKDVQFLIKPAESEVKFPPKTRLSNEVHPEKAKLPISKRPSVFFISLSFEHPEKLPSPIEKPSPKKSIS